MPAVGGAGRSDDLPLTSGRLLEVQLHIVRRRLAEDGRGVIQGDVRERHSHRRHPVTWRHEVVSHPVITAPEHR